MRERAQTVPPEEKRAARAGKLGKRAAELDVIRGVSVLLMIWDHLMFDLWGLLPSLFSDYPRTGHLTGYLEQFALWYWNWDTRLVVRYFVAFLFLAVSGICCSFSKNNLLRGVKLLGVALLLSAATGVYGVVTGDTDMTILCGVLHCIAISLILIGALDRFVRTKWVYLILGTVMTLIGVYLELHVQIVTFRWEDFGSIWWRQILGIVECGGDSFPLLFNGGQIFIGVFLGKAMYPDRASLFPSLSYPDNFVTFAGRHSLLVYVAHQVLLPLIAGVLLLLAGYHLAL